MASRLLRRPLLANVSALTPQTTSSTRTPYTPSIQTQTRNATLIRRPRRPYTFTQLVQLSDGSTYTMRTTSPIGMYKSQKDTRNHIMWNPLEQSLKNVEVDEAGKLAAFRERFGRSYDLGTKGGEEKADGKPEGSGDALGDLLASYSTSRESEMQGKVGTKSKKFSGKL